MNSKADKALTGCRTEVWTEVEEKINARLMPGFWSGRITPLVGGASNLSVHVTKVREASGLDVPDSRSSTGVEIMTYLLTHSLQESSATVRRIPWLAFYQSGQAD